METLYKTLKAGESSKMSSNQSHTRTRHGPDIRTYEKTHPWITFHIDMQRAGPEIWMALGEVQSKCEHIAGAPMRPEAAKVLHEMFLAKGLMATAAIEGNTLSEEEVDKRIKGDLKLPPSKEYLGKEIDNVCVAANALWADVMDDERILNSDDIKRYNGQILHDLDVDEHTVPGEIREHRVEVGPYRGAPPEDCEYLVDRMCDWLASDTFQPREGYEIVYGVLKAIVAHLYIAWIHPFGDGNGRTARLVEVRLLLEAGAPSSAAHLLSNHYNETRAEYYRQLKIASQSGGDIMPFIKYATIGLCHQLREQIDIIRAEQVKVSWENYVHAQFKDKKSDADYRRRHLVLAISDNAGGVRRADIRKLNPQLAILYNDKTVKTVNRDVNALMEMKLLVVGGKGLRAAVQERLSGFLPPRKGSKPSEGLANKQARRAAALGRQAGPSVAAV